MKVMSKRKTRDVRPWNVKPGMLMRVGVLPLGASVNTSTLVRVIDVEKTRGKVTGERCWRITFETDPSYPPFTGKPDSVLRFRDQRVTVES